jgi:2,3-bisphosphoglycerate-independent phosphoglycerate mutase
MSNINSRRRVISVIMDGIGISSNPFGNAVSNANTPHLNWLRSGHTWRTLLAHGTAVGLPTDTDIGNSEVGHNALGAGRIYDQGAKLVESAILTRSIFDGATWNHAVQNVKSYNQNTLHFIGLLSDGNVHSNENHLFAMLRQAKKEGVKIVRIHVLFDGRDVGEKSAEVYIGRLNQIILELSDSSFDIKVASGGGRMRITMDRYQADWPMVKRGWDCHVHAIASHQFKNLDEALHFFRKDPHIKDQYIPEFIIETNGKPNGPIKDHDSVIFFNFRGDRAIEICQAFEDGSFNKFDRGQVPNIYFAGMMEYDGDLKIPKNYLVSPPHISDTLGEYLTHMGIKQFACSETQKYGHVTYFWNGNRSGYFDKGLEEYLEIKSDENITFDLKPWMKCHEITEATINRIHSKSFDFGRINFPNGDMVGHTGNYDATILGVESVDLMIGRIIEACRLTDTILILTADHGNADEMFDAKASDFVEWKSLPPWKRPTPKTAHTINPVPFAIFDPRGPNKWILKSGLPSASIGHFANTVLSLLGMEERNIYLPSLVTKGT